MGGTTIPVDICAIRLIVDDVGLGSQCVEHTLRDRRSASVGTVQSDLCIFKGTGCHRNQMTDITVPARDIINCTPDPLARRQWQLPGLSIDVVLNLLLDLRLDLLAASADDLDSVVIVWIVARRNHDSTVKILRTHDK